MLRIPFAGAVAALALSSVAQAADLPSRTAAPIAPAIVPVSVFSWTGVYGGLKAGYAFGGEDKFGIRSSAGMLNNDAGNVGLRGGQFGGFVGYNYQFAGTPFVVGAEADIAGGRLTRSTSTASLSPFASSFVARSSSDWNGSLRLRAGYAFDRALVYATGGVAFVDNKYRAQIGTSTATFDKSETLTGWTVGAGIDYAMTNNWFAGLEYRYTGMPKQSLTSSNGVYVTERSPNFHTIGARVGYKF